MTCKIVPRNDRWFVILKDGEEVFSSESRQACENYCYVNGLTVLSYYSIY